MAISQAWCPSPILYKLKNQILKITQFDKAHFIKMNELKLTEVELFSFFHFMLIHRIIFCGPLANIDHFLYHSNLSLQMSNFISMHTPQLKQKKIN